MSSSATKPLTLLGGIVGALRLALAAMALLGALGPAARAEIFLAYQAMPAPGTGMPLFDQMPYAERDRLTRAVAASIVPKVMRALNLAAENGPTMVVPGGYQGRTDPSLVTRLQGPGPPGAEQVAAALGYVLRQESVLVANSADRAGRQFYARVRFAAPGPTPGMADAFYRHATKTHAGLGGGFTVTGDAMLFINLRDERGRPYGGLGDADFLTALHLAAATFDLARPVVTGSGYMRASFVGNDWQRHPAGADYLSRLRHLSPATVAALRSLNAAAADLVRGLAR